MRFSSGVLRSVIIGILAIPALAALLAYAMGAQAQKAAKIEEDTAHEAIQVRENAAARLRRKGNLDAAKVWQP
jgi:hypothetical protein